MADNSTSAAAFIKTSLASSEKRTEVVVFGWRSMRFTLSLMRDWKRAHAIIVWSILKAICILSSSDCWGLKKDVQSFYTIIEAPEFLLINQGTS